MNRAEMERRLNELAHSEKQKRHAFFRRKLGALEEDTQLVPSPVRYTPRPGDPVPRALAASLLLPLLLAGCRSSPVRDDIALDPRPALKDHALGDTLSDSLSELGVRRMIPIMPLLFFLPVIPQVRDPLPVETPDRLGNGLDHLLGTFAHANTDLFQPWGDWILVYAPRDGDARRFELLVTYFDPALPGTEPGPIVAATARGVLRRTARPDAYRLDTVRPAGQSYDPLPLVIFGPPDLVARKLLPALVPTTTPPVRLDTVAGPFLGVPVAGEPELYALPVFANATTPASVRGVKPLSESIWAAAYDTEQGRRWGPLTWSPLALSGPRWRSVAIVPGVALTALLRETAGATTDQSYLLVQQEDLQWAALLPFAAPLVAATPCAFATGGEAVAAAESRSRATLDEFHRKQAEERARIARAQAQAGRDFDAAMERGDQSAARSALCSLAPGDALRWKRFVEKYGLEESSWESRIDKSAARRNGVPESFLATARVNHPPRYEAPQSDWDYFWNGPRDGSYTPAVSGYTSILPSSSAPSAPSAPQRGAWDSYYEKQYHDVVRRYSR